MMADIDVYDFNNSVAEFICAGLRKYIEENKKATFPTCADAILDEAARLWDNEDKLVEWHRIIEALADKFEMLSKEYHPSQESINEAFDELKRIYKGLWI